MIEEGEEEDEYTEVPEAPAPRVLRQHAQVPAPAGPVVKNEIANPAVPKSPAVSADPEPIRLEPVQPEPDQLDPVQSEPVQPEPVSSEPRRSRMEVTSQGKSYAAVVRIGLMKVVSPGGRRMWSVPSRVVGKCQPGRKCKASHEAFDA